MDPKKRGAMVSVTRLTPGPRGAMLTVPLEGRVLLRPAQLRERLWQAYAYALNTDDEGGPSRTGYRRFVDELRDLHDEVCGGVMIMRRPEAVTSAVAFATRWRLRRRDVWGSCRLMEMHNSPGNVDPDMVHLQLPLVVYDAPAEFAPIEVAPAAPALVYDVTEVTGAQLRAQVEERYRSALRAIDAAEQEWLRAGLLVQVSAHHADSEVLTRFARRWMQKVKGWTLAEIASREGVTLSSIRSSLSSWRTLDRDRLEADDGFTPDR